VSDEREQCGNFVTQNPKGYMVSAVRRSRPLFVRFGRAPLKTPAPRLAHPRRARCGRLPWCEPGRAGTPRYLGRSTIGVALARHPDVGWTCLRGAGHSAVAAAGASRSRFSGGPGRRLAWQSGLAFWNSAYEDGFGRQSGSPSCSASGDPPGCQYCNEKDRVRRPERGS